MSWLCYRGRGPLKSTMDVINAAKKISEAGTKLDNLATKIAEQVKQSLYIDMCPLFLSSVSTNNVSGLPFLVDNWPSKLLQEGYVDQPLDLQTWYHRFLVNHMYLWNSMHIYVWYYMSFHLSLTYMKQA